MAKYMGTRIYVETFEADDAAEAFEVFSEYLTELMPLVAETVEEV